MEGETIIVPDSIQANALRIEYCDGISLVGLEASQLWLNFISNNIPFLVSGDLHIYPLEVARRHHTHPIQDSPLRRNITPLTDIGAQLADLSWLGSTKTAAVSHTFGLSPVDNLSLEDWDGTLPRYPVLHVSLIGIDFEQPPNPNFLKLLVRTYEELEIPVVIYFTGASYFATCFGNVFLDDFSLVQAYARIVERIVAIEEPEKLDWLKQFTEPMKHCRRRIDLENIAWAIHNNVGHRGDKNCVCVDLRHMKNAILANKLGRDDVPHTPGEPFLTIQLYFRVGEKRGGDTPLVVYASPQIPFIVGKTIPFFE